MRKFIKQEKIVKLIWLKYLIKIKNEIHSCELFNELTKIKNNNLSLILFCLSKNATIYELLPIIITNKKHIPIMTNY